MLTGMLRLQDERRNLGDDEESAETRLANYSLRFHPLETASLSLSLTDSRGYVLGQRIQQSTAVLSQFHGTPLPALAMSMEGGFSRNRQELAGKTFETWSFLASCDGDVSRRVGAVVSYAYRISRETESRTSVEQNRLGGSLTLRLTQTLFLRGEAEAVHDGSLYLSHLYNGSWRAFPKLAFGAQASFTEGAEGSGTERISGFADYELSAASDLYFRYHRSRTWGESSDEPATTSLQSGFRAGF